MNDLYIKKIRTDLGLTQVEFAKRLGISMRTVKNLDFRGFNRPKAGSSEF